MMAESVLMAVACFCLSVADVGMHFQKVVRRYSAVVTILSCLLTTGSAQWDGSNRYVSVILYPLAAGT